MDGVSRFDFWDADKRIGDNMYLLLGCEVSENGGWHGTPPSGNWTQTMEIDRIEVHEWH